MLIESLKALLIGIVEGLTEWLPVSSTGHMILVDAFVKLDVSDAFLKMFLVVIQLGAILAVLILYWHRLNPFSRTKTATERRSTLHLWGMVVVGSIPAAVIGVLADDWVNEHFYNKVTVACALIFYGVVFIAIERANKRRLQRMERAGHVQDPAEALFAIRRAEDIDWKHALSIGFFQVLAIVPGTSRSGATIIGGMLTGCSRAAAAEFTFFLAIPIMFGWGAVKLAKFAMAGVAATSVEVAVLAVGCIAAFATSVLAIRFLMGYIKKHDFSVFGWYRIALGLAVLAFWYVETHGLPF